VSGVGDSPHDFNGFVRDTRRRITALERRQVGLGAVDLSAFINAGQGISTSGSGVTGDPLIVRTAPYAISLNDFGLGNDWNNALENGVYMTSSGLNAPGGSAAWWIGFVEAHNSLYVTQTLHAFTTDSSANTEVWRRSSTDIGGGVIGWQGWYKLQWSQQEQDVRYVRGASGQMKAATGVVTGIAGVPNGGGLNVPVTFPAGWFTTTTGLTATAILDNGRPTTSRVTGSLTTAGVTFRLDNWSPAGSAGGHTLEWMAIGV
jgi:hypothetical protein